MGLTIDKLLGPLIHNHKSGDITDGDSRWVNASGDTMTGVLNMGTNAIRMTDSNGVVWNLTLNTDGALVTTVNTSPLQGNPVGLLLAITYPSDL